MANIRSIKTLSELPDNAPMSASEVALFLNVAGITVHRWTNAGFLGRPKKMGRVKFYRAADIRNAVA